MQRQDFSQATSTLGNTPNLHIGSYQGKPYIGSSDRVFYIGSQTGKAAYDFLCSSKARFCKWMFQAAICFEPAFSFRGALRFDRR